jgi:hypothetical protein
MTKEKKLITYCADYTQTTPDQTIPACIEHLKLLLNYIENCIIFDSHCKAQVFRDDGRILFYSSTSWVRFNNELDKVINGYLSAEYYYTNKHQYLDCLICKKVGTKRIQSSIAEIDTERTMIDLKDLI